ncbi:MAG: hypothetical protein V1720_05835 [bacterium]
MKPKIKSSLILVVTLFIGIAIGFEISEIMIKKRFESFKDVREPKGFVNMFNEILKPGENQKAEVDSILLKYHKQIDSVFKSGFAVVKTQMDSMRTELSKILNKEQMDRFDKEREKMKNPPRDHKPPPSF